jgi:hypothetical protein
VRITLQSFFECKDKNIFRLTHDIYEHITKRKRHFRKKFVSLSEISMAAAPAARDD